VSSLFCSTTIYGGYKMKIAIICVVIMIVLLTPIIVKAEIKPDTIAGMWLFDEGSGNAAKDSSGNGFNGELNGDAKWVDGKFGKALEFHGGDYVQLKKSEQGLPFGGVEPFSITAWVNTQGGGGTVVGKYNGGVIGAYILLASGTVSFHREVAPWGLAGSMAITAGKFTHIAATYDGAEMRIYVGGKLDVKQDRAAQNTDMATPVLIGARQTQGKPSDFFTGVLDEVIMFKIALDENQIAEVMKGMSPTKAVSPSSKLASTWGSIKF
jgi:hypothetical protein